MNTRAETVSCYRADKEATCATERQWEDRIFNTDFAALVIDYEQA